MHAPMDAEARHRACVEFRDRLSRDTGTHHTALTAANCEYLLDTTHQGGEVSLHSDPGLFYAYLGEAVRAQTLALDVPNRVKVGWWCFREAAEVHGQPRAMHSLADCYYFGGRGVARDVAQAAVWFQRAADLGYAASKSSLGALLLNGVLSDGIGEDAARARGFAITQEACAQGYCPAIFTVAKCYLTGKGVDKDVARGVAYLRQLIATELTSTGDVATVMSPAVRASAQSALGMCYATGEGVEADTVQAALLLERAVGAGRGRCTLNG